MNSSFASLRLSRLCSQFKLGKALVLLLDQSLHRKR